MFFSSDFGPTPKIRMGEDFQNEESGFSSGQMLLSSFANIITWIISLGATKSKQWAMKLHTTGNASQFFQRLTTGKNYFSIFLWMLIEMLKLFQSMKCKIC